MKKQLESNKVAILTGAAIQDDETFKSEGGFIPERDQYYFQIQQGGNVFGEIPEIGDKRWLQMSTLYGNDILMVEFKETI